MTVDCQQYGFALFDDTHRHESGLAALYGGGAPFRFGHPCELPANAVFMTNLEYALSLGKEDSHGQAWPSFKTSNFLSGLFGPHEMSVSQTTVPVRHLNGGGFMFTGGNGFDVAMAANLFARVNILAGRYFNAGMTEEGTLSKGLRRLYGGLDPLAGNPEYTAIRAATLAYNACGGARKGGNGQTTALSASQPVRMAFSMPRVAHAGRVMRTMLPVGFCGIEKKQLPPPSAVSEWVERQQTPFLACVAVSAYEPEFQNLFDLGAGRLARRWVTGDELFILAQHASVKVLAVVKAESFTVAPLSSVLGEALDPCNEISVSTGAFLLNAWQAMYRRWPGMPRQAGSNGGGFSANPYAPFVMATDRLLCLVEAANLARLGFEVYGYGNGGVVAGWRGTLDGAAVEIRKTRLIPQLMSASHCDSNIEGKALCDSEAGVLQEMCLCGEKRLIEQADTVIVGLLCSKKDQL